MNSRDRVIKAFNHEEVDRIPLFITVTPELAGALAENIGVRSYTLADSPLSQNRISFHEILTKLGNDVVGIGACSPSASPMQNLGNNFYKDEWQIEYRKIGYYTDQTTYPLIHAETVTDIRNFAWPDPLAPGRFDLAKKVVAEYGSEYAVCGDLECTIFEQSWHMIGMEKFFLDLIMEKDYIFELMDHVMAYSIGVGKELVQLGADFIWLGDDMGTQRGMLISPSMWRTYFKERMGCIIKTLKSENPNLKIAYHSCGSYFPIISDLIEIGVDILNALQPNAADMELSRLKKLYGDEVVFFGGLDVQAIIPFGTTEETEQEVRRVIAAAGEGGGLLLAGSHNFQPDVTVEKIMKIYEVAFREGRYPLQIK